MKILITSYGDPLDIVKDDNGNTYIRLYWIPQKVPVTTGTVSIAFLQRYACDLYVNVLQQTSNTLLVETSDVTAVAKLNHYYKRIEYAASAEIIEQ